MSAPGQPDRPLADRLGQVISDARAHERAHGAVWSQAIPPPYAYALSRLEQLGRPFTPGEAAAALEGAFARLDLDDAPPYDRTGWPAPGDVRAFLQALLADEYVHADGRGGYAVDAARMPF